MGRALNVHIKFELHTYIRMCHCLESVIAFQLTSSSQNSSCTGEPSFEYSYKQCVLSHGHMQHCIILVHIHSYVLLIHTDRTISVSQLELLSGMQLAPFSLAPGVTEVAILGGCPKYS